MRRPAGRVPLDDLVLVSGTSHTGFAERIARELRVELAKARVSKFSDGETRIDLLENVRGREVYVIQSLCAPANDNLMELVLLADSARRSSARGITAVVPYLGYSRQDRRVRSTRVPISARVVADIIGGAGFKRVLTMDLHAEQIQGFYSIPVDNVYATPVMLGDLARRGHGGGTVTVSPDVGGVARARAFARLCDADLAIIDKRRPAENVAEVMNIIGDVRGKVCVLVDDIVDTANTLCRAGAALKDAGARAVVAYCTHPVLSGDAAARVADSVLDDLVVSDTIPLSQTARECGKIRQLSVADLIAEAVARVHTQESVSSLFME